MERQVGPLNKRISNMNEGECMAEAAARLLCLQPAPSPPAPGTAAGAAAGATAEPARARPTAQALADRYSSNPANPESARFSALAEAFFPTGTSGDAVRAYFERSTSAGTVLLSEGCLQLARVWRVVAL